MKGRQPNNNNKLRRPDNHFEGYLILVSVYLLQKATSFFLWTDSGVGNRRRSYHKAGIN